MNAVKYDFDAFVTEGNAAPQRAPEREEKRDIKRVEPKTSEELHSQEMFGLKKSMGLLLFVSLIFTFVIMQVSAGAKNYEIARLIHKTKQEIAIEQSENIRLNSELNGITSIYAVDTYATEILGMSRVENYQVECVDLSEGDAVIFSSGLFGR